MRHIPLLASLGLLALAGPAFATDAPAKVDRTETVLGHVVDEVIRPGYHRFLDRTVQLGDAMSALCAAPSPAGEEKARAAFDETLKAWGAIEIIRSGPALEMNRFERVLYYPDRKSIGLKQIQAILATRDETATNAGTLAGKSVGVQGLGALEFVLYGTGNEVLASEKNGHRCRYGAAISGNLHTIAGELASAWDAPDGIGDRWKKPGPQNPAFRDEKEAVTELLGTMVHGAEMVREQRLKGFFPVTDSKSNPKAAPFWRSGKTWTLMTANLEGLSTLWKKAHMEILLKDDQRSIASSIGFVLKSLVRMAPTVTPDIERSITDKTERAKVDFLMLNSKDLIVRLGDDYGKALGLGAGFSFSDGD